MTLMRSTEFLNRVDDPAGERWIVRADAIPGGIKLQIGEDEDGLLDFVFDPQHALAFAGFLRAALQNDDSVHHSLDLRSDEEIYARIGRTDHLTWRMIISRLGGDVEMYVDDATLHRLVSWMATELEAGDQTRLA